MKHVSRVLCAGLVSLSLVGGSEFARGSDSEGQSASAIAIEVVSVATILGSAVYAGQQLVTASNRTDFHSRPVINASGDRLLTARERVYSSPNPTLAAKVLEGTVPGDVIHIRYLAGTPEALQAAVQDLDQSRTVWANRVAELQTQRAGLVSEAAELRRVTTNVPAEEIKYRNGHQVKLVRLEREIVNLDKVLKDADARMHSANGNYQAARLNLGATLQSGKMNGKYHIMRDLLVDSRTHFELRSFFAQNLAGRTAGAAQAALPHVQITRVQGANSKVVAGSLTRMKGGLFAIGVGVVVLVEEFTVGAISNSLGNLATEHFMPAPRTEPAGPSASID